MLYREPWSATGGTPPLSLGDQTMIVPSLKYQWDDLHYRYLGNPPMGPAWGDISNEPVYDPTYEGFHEPFDNRLPMSPCAPYLPPSPMTARALPSAGAWPDYDVPMDSYAY
jgi:hypothetical protein